MDHLTNKIEQERPDKGGFNQLVSHEQAVINQNIIEVGSLLELLRDNVSVNFEWYLANAPQPYS